MRGLGDYVQRSAVCRQGGVASNSVVCLTSLLREDSTLARDARLSRGLPVALGLSAHVCKANVRTLGAAVSEWRQDGLVVVLQWRPECTGRARDRARYGNKGHWGVVAEWPNAAGRGAVALTDSCKTHSVAGFRRFRSVNEFAGLVSATPPVVLIWRGEERPSRGA